MDAVLARREENRLQLNDGRGFFRDAGPAGPIPFSEASRAVALGDVDLDGDVNAMFGNDRRNRLYSNLTRHLAWRSVPRVGKPLAMQIRGPASGTWALFVAARSARVPTPFGELGIDPLVAIPATAGSLNGRGEATVTLAVPPDPRGIGVAPYWQTFIAHPQHLTNRETTVLTGL